MSTLTLGGSTLANKTGSVVSINDGVILPEGGVIQTVNTSFGNRYSGTFTAGNFDFGTASTRADNSFVGVVQGLTTSITSRVANSKFLIFINLQQCANSAMHQGYNWAMSVFSSVDSYATAISRGASDGALERTSTGFWAYYTGSGDNTINVSTNFLYSPNQSASTAITFKIVLDTSYTSTGNTLHINRKHNYSDTSNQMSTPSTITILEIAP